MISTTQIPVIQQLDARLDRAANRLDKLVALTQWSWEAWCYDSDLAWRRATEARQLAYELIHEGYDTWSQVGDSLLAIAHLLIRMSRYDEITSHIEDAAMLYSYAGDTRGYLRCTYMRALYQVGLSDDESAYEILQLGLQDPHVTEHPVIMGQMQALLGTVFCHMGACDSAAVYFETAQATLRAAGNALVEGQVLAMWVMSALTQLDPLLVINRALSALPLQREQSDWHSQYHTIRTLIRAYLKIGDIESARQHLDGFAMIAHHIHTLVSPHHGLMLQAEVEFHEGNLDQADAYMSSATMMLSQLHNPYEIIELREVAALIYQAKENFEWALMHTQEIKSLQQRLLADGRRRRVHSLRIPNMMAIARRTVEQQQDKTQILTSRVDEMTRLLEMYDEVSSNLNVAYVASLSLDAAMRMANADAGFFAVLEDDEWVIPSMLGTYDQATMQLNDELRSALERRHVIVLSDKQVTVPGLPSNSSSQVRILMPLLISDRLVGLLNVETTNPLRFTANVYELLDKMKGFVAIALDNALLYERLADRNRELAASLQKVTRLENLKTDMIRLASHDLKQPLTIMRLYLSMVQSTASNNLSDTQLGYFAAMNNAIKMMDRLITDILSLERIEQMAINPPDTVFDLLEVCREVVDFMAVQASDKKQTFTFLTDLTQAHVRGDRTNLGEAINNFISNAIKYTPEGGTIQARMYVVKNQVYFEVQDSGIGISKEEQSRIFEASYRVNTEQTQGISGTGWGLYLVKKIVETHNGTISFTSERGVGSTFGFNVPHIIV